jgi:F-type H+-transporting ATPase subunit delta
MHELTHFSPTAEAYARSLLELAGNDAAPAGHDLDQIREIVETNRTFRLYLADPAIGELERGETLKRIFAGKISPLLMNFIGVLNEKGRLGMLVEIADAYDHLLDEKLGKIEVDVIVAQKLSPDQLEQVRQKVSSALKKDAVVHQYVDESIIGGLVLRVQDKLIDASVKTQLAAMKEKLLAARPS